MNLLQSILAGVILCGACDSALAQSSRRVWINELQSSNVTTAPEIADFNDFSDWFELYNADSVAADIGGCFLTDKRGSPTKWPIPAGTMIPARGFLRIWADGYDDQPGRSHQRPYYPFDAFVTRYYHTNFKLDRAGEYLAFVGRDTVIIDSVGYGYQPRDVSFGRQPDGAPTWRFFGEPTPGAANTTAGIDTVVHADPPSLDPVGGFFGGPVSVTIIPPTVSAEIRYTLNGTLPGSASTVYTGPIVLSAPAVLTARTFEPGKAPSACVTRSYFVGMGSTLPVISLSTPPALLWDPVIGIYANNYKSREVPVHMELYDADRRLEVELNAALSLTGQASLLYPQKSFTVSADDRFGSDAIETQVFPERRQNAFSSLYLRNAGVPDHRSTLFRDALLHTLLLNRLDVDCQAYRPATVFLNAQYWGILNIRDKINRFYISDLHRVNPDDVDIIEYQANVTPTVMEGNDENYQLFMAFVTQNDLSQEPAYRTVEAWMDIDEFIHYMIAGIYDDNCFWMDENVRLWRERRPGARWRWILHDTDFGFGMPNWRSTGVSHNTLRFATSSNTGEPFVPPLWSTMLFRKLLQHPEFRTSFIRQFASALNTVFHTDTVVAAIDRIQARLMNEMPRHINRWKDGDPYYGNPIPDLATWQSNVEVLRTFARQRPAYQRQHLIQYFGLSGTSVLALTLPPVGGGRVRVNGIEHITKSSTGIHFRNVPIHLEAVPDVSFRFVRWDGPVASTENPWNVTPVSDTLSVTAVFEAVLVDTLPGRLTRDTILTRDHSPYVARSTVVIDSGVTVEVGSGVELHMSAGASIIVHGRLLIEGTAEDPVRIRPRFDGGSWGALCFVNPTDSSALTHVAITGATLGPDFDRDRAAVSGLNARLGLRHVSIADVQMPVFIRGGTIVLLDSRIRSTYAGDLLNVKFASVAVTERCELSGGEGYDSDAIDYDGVQSGVVRDNLIYGIYGFNSDAVDLGEGAKDILVEGNRIFNISDKGVSVGQASTTLIRRNLIVNCGYGVAVKDFGSFARIEHTTFYGNAIAVGCYEKILGHGGGSAEVVSSILANSRESATFVDALSKLSVTYSLSNTTVLNGLHNQQSDPQFLNDLFLAATSPALDAGSPLLPADPDGSLPDLGAFPRDASRVPRLMINEIHYHPAEGGEEFVEIANTGPVAVSLNGYRLIGDIETTFGDLSIAAGEHLVLTRDPAPFSGKGFRVFAWSSGRLPDTAGTIILLDAAAREVDAVRYHHRGSWPREADGTGPSLELHRPDLENLASSSWSVSYASGGSPGRSRASTLLSGLYINEFMADNDAVIRDDAGDYDDWVELYNAATVPVDIGGLFITDNLANPGKYMIPTTDATATTIPAKGFLVLWADGQTTQGVRHLSIKLDKAGEQIGLVRSVDGSFTFIDSVTFGAQVTNRSFGRSPDGSASWISLSAATPGAANGPVSGVESEGIPTMTGLEQNYPNPFNPETRIGYRMKERGWVKVAVYDLLGREVSVLVDEEKAAGFHEAVFSSQSSAARLSTGIYFCRLTVGGSVETKKMILVR